ncbi:MAG: hydrogenase maturation nickel metallochaperone HypA [Caldimicrobium thiodismutans]|uniref:Hydrogenase maturation factor HypA n=1 Tax=Caldimicrobium thiodismutans TaxID=1653476 RepID=A0A2N7PHV7_9BACT|nr:MAG: hydrogenase maturation nickel metallochaperone HypA [Caldimicrobium thiodismutans]
MHEYSLFLSLLKTIEEYLKPYEKPKISKVILSIGIYSGVDLEYLDEVIRNFKVGTLLEEAEIIFEREPLRVQCFQCGKIGEPTIQSASCPFCGSFDTKIIGGFDFILRTLEIEDEEGSPN